MAVLLGALLRIFAAVIYALFLVVDKLADVALALRLEVSWEFLAVGLFLIVYGRGGQLAVVVTLGFIAWLEWGAPGAPPILALEWGGLPGQNVYGREPLA